LAGREPMKYTTIRIEGPILSADILDKIEQGDLGGQLPKDFGFDGKVKVKDEIAKAWADAQDLWRVFKHQREKVGESKPGTTETRRFWIIPLLDLLGYDTQLSKKEMVNGKSFAISHRAANINGYPIQIMGFNDNLDKKRLEGGPRISPHALVQEYLNLTEHLFALVTNGLQLRLLRDSSRLIRLSFLEFDLEAMMEDDHYSDFAIMYRLLHCSRMPQKMDAGPDSKIEKYHQDALDSGSRIREGLSQAVEKSIISLANGFLSHTDNAELQKAVDEKTITAEKYYQYMLRLIYRLLFLMVIEERNLIYLKNCDHKKRKIFYDYYSISRLRKLCEKHYLADKRFSDLWIALKNTFRLFEDEKEGKPLDIKPLAGELFSYNAIGLLNESQLENKTILECLRNLSVFINEKTKQKMRVNYASLNVEEFGSVYEGLLEYDGAFTRENGNWKFVFVKGEGRSSSGSHYTADELVQPLIRHSLDHVIEEKLKSTTDHSSRKNGISTSLQQEGIERSLLSIKICDVACGSGHFLLNAARRIGTELAKVRTGEDQPSPEPLRTAIRDVIRNCIYGVDKNPLAVELCKVALWLEAHNPGEPLNFLDHRIKCGDAIVGVAHAEELQNGIATEAFKTQPGDDKDIAATFRKLNKEERNTRGQIKFDYEKQVKDNIQNIAHVFEEFNRMPENTPQEIELKQKKYYKLTSGANWNRLKKLADLQTAQFFIPRTLDNKNKLITDAEYNEFLNGEKPLVGQTVAKAEGLGAERKFFHWFLEFPMVFARGGFDCILGNPPFLGGTKISTFFGKYYFNILKTKYFPAASRCDLIGYFLRRLFTIIQVEGFFSIIATNTISEGDTREGAIDVIVTNNGIINHAVKSMPWPGQANVIISLLTIFKGDWQKQKWLNGKIVNNISNYFSDEKNLSPPKSLKCNFGIASTGVSVMGDGFLLTENDAKELLKIEKNNEVVFRYINGIDLNSSYNP